MRLGISERHDGTLDTARVACLPWPRESRRAAYHSELSVSPPSKPAMASRASVTMLPRRLLRPRLRSIVFRVGAWTKEASPHALETCEEGGLLPRWPILRQLLNNTLPESRPRRSRTRSRVAPDVCRYIWDTDIWPRFRGFNKVSSAWQGVV